MLLNSVVLILQEILEAALLVSVLMAFTRVINLRVYWLAGGIGLGCIGSLILSLNMVTISEWFDYVGQEVVNASLQFAITLVLALLTLLYSLKTPATLKWLPFCMTLAVACSLTREGSEIFIYIEGVLSQPPHIRPTLTGSGIGAGIGISVGVLLYYGLLGLPRHWIIYSCLLLLAIIAGNMSAQAAVLLIQADWLSSSIVLWNSSNWLPENSIPGHLLYALIGYEATPSLLQGLAYGAGILSVIMAWSLGRICSKATP
ncbi:FTR1 family protein [Porticoccus sp.]